MRDFIGRGVRRLGVLGGVLGGGAALVAAGTLAPGTAFAAEDGYSFTYLDHVIPPGQGTAVALRPDLLTGTPDGTLVYALSKAPLTDASWAKGGLPAGMTATVDSNCTPAPRVKGVFLCPTSEDNGYVGPAVSAGENVKDDTKLHFGVAYAPRGTSIDKAVKAAQLSASSPVKGRVEAHTVRVLTAEHVKKNKVLLTTPDVPAGGSVRHTVTIHAIDKGVLSLGFSASRPYRQWDPDELKVELVSVKGGAGASGCTVKRGELTWEGLTCDVKPGDVTITYKLKADAKSPNWKIDAAAQYNVYTAGWSEAGGQASFGVKGGTPVRERYVLLRRDTAGVLNMHQGSGKAPGIFGRSDTGDPSWQRYTAVTKLSPLLVQGTGGPVVGRDKAGVLWNYDLADDTGGGLYEPKKVGGGWNVYDALVGAGDLTGDGKPDLIAREPSGALWLYTGTGKPKAPFDARVKTGGNWAGLKALAGASDLTGDGKPDLVATDAAGTAWLYPGTGKAAAPFAKRLKVATGWSSYDALVVSGDMNSDGRADLLARDGSGRLWLLKGTGKAAAPFAARVKVSGGWAAGDLLI